MNPSTTSFSADDPGVPVVYEDNHLLVVIKPVNMPTQADESGDPDLLTVLKQDLKSRHNKPGNVYLGMVHRLDRPAGGVMVFGKTSKAASRLSDAVRTRSLGKRYLAVVHGIPKQASGRLNDYLLKDSGSNTVSIVDSNSCPRAKEAILDYQLKDTREGLSLVEISLHTGRSHQIRVQMAGIGCPLYGDQKYGSSHNKPGQQLALWSQSVTLQHPTLLQEMTWECLPPSEYPWSLWELVAK